MEIGALVTGVLGGLCTVYGALDAFGVLPASASTDKVDWVFWLMAAVVLLLGSVVLLLARNREID
jgi:hypothetical protein